MWPRQEGLLTTLCPVPIHMRVWISVREEWIDSGCLKRSELLYTRVRKARRNRR